MVRHCTRSSPTWQGRSQSRDGLLKPRLTFRSTGASRVVCDSRSRRGVERGPPHIGLTAQAPARVPILGGLLHRTFPSRARLDDETDPAVALVEDVCVAPGGVSAARPRTSAPASERACGLSPRRTSPPGLATCLPGADARRLCGFASRRPPWTHQSSETSAAA
jgi:hypothetical protein